MTASLTASLCCCCAFCLQGCRPVGRFISSVGHTWAWCAACIQLLHNICSHIFVSWLLVSFGLFLQLNIHTAHLHSSTAALLTALTPPAVCVSVRNKSLCLLVLTQSESWAVTLITTLQYFDETKILHFNIFSFHFWKLNVTESQDQAAAAVYYLLLSLWVKFHQFLEFEENFTLSLKHFWLV